MKETNENACFYFMIGLLWSLVLIHIISVLWWEINSKQEISTRVNQKKFRSSRKEYHVNMLSILTNEKHFPKTINQWEFGYGLFTNLLRIIVACDLLLVHSNSEEVSYLSWQNSYPNLKTTSHIKLNFFLWTKLPENVLLAKYLITLQL